jgi:hypothetical protein
MSATNENRTKAIVDNYKERLQKITNIDKNHPIVINKEWENFRVLKKLAHESVNLLSI